MTVRGSDRVTVRRRTGVTVRRWTRVAVRRANSMHLVAARIVAVMSPAVAARKTQKRHGSHAGAPKNHTEDV